MEDEVLADIEARANRRSWRAREMVFARGDEGNHLLVILEGRLKLSILSPAGRELLIRVAVPGDLVGEIACFDGGLRSADAVAIEPVRAVVLSRTDLRAVAARHPTLHEAMIAYLGALLRGTNDRLEALALHSLQARLARYILFALDTQDASPVEAKPYLVLNLTQGDLSLFLGASRPKVNRLLAEFREVGAVVPEGRGWRCDRAALRAMAEALE